MKHEQEQITKKENKNMGTKYIGYLIVYEDVYDGKAHEVDSWTKTYEEAIKKIKTNYATALYDHADIYGLRENGEIDFIDENPYGRKFEDKWTQI